MNSLKHKNVFSKRIMVTLNGKLWDVELLVKTMEKENEKCC